MASRVSMVRSVKLLDVTVTTTWVDSERQSLLTIAKRFREIEIGDINPIEEDTAVELHIGGLNLKPSDLMKYIYDLGD